MKHFIPLFKYLGSISLTFLLITFCTSCSHFFYAGTPHQTAWLKDKNEISATAGLGSADETNFGYINAAWAASNKLGFYGQYYKAWHNGTKDDGQYGELAAGTFGPFVNSHFRYETFAGCGFGSAKNIFGDSGITLNNAFQKYFAQGNIGYVHKNFQLGFCLRGGYVSQYKVEYSAGKNGKIADDYYPLNENRTHIAVEPGIYMGFGWDMVKFRAGYGITTMNPVGKSKTNYNYQNSFLTFGLQFRISAEKSKHAAAGS